MIARHWHATARPTEVASYLEHLRSDTFPALSKIPGFRGATVLRKPGAAGTDLLVITEWDSLAAIEAFAGEDRDAAVVPALVQSLMVSFDKRVEHWEAIAAHATQQGAATTPG